MRKCATVLVLVAVALMSRLGIAGDKLTDRNVIRSGIGPKGEVIPESEFAKQSQIKTATSVNFRILLIKTDGEELLVPDTYDFKVGHRFRVELETDSDLHLYVFHEGPTGDRSLLLPAPSQLGRGPLAKKGERTVLPGKRKYFEFTPPKGTERLLIYATPAGLPELIPANPSDQEAQAEAKRARDEIFRRAREQKTGLPSSGPTAEARPTTAGRDHLFRRFDIQHSQGRNIIVGGDDPASVPEVLHEIVLTSR